MCRGLPGSADLGQFYAIFRNTVLETVRQPLYALVLAVQCVFIAISPAFSAQIYTFGAGSGMEHSAERMMADLCLSTVMLCGLILSVFASASAIGREVEGKTALTVLSKDVSRTAYVFAKYLGIAACLALAGAVGVIATMLCVRIGAKVAVSDPLDYGAIAGLIAAAALAAAFATARNYFRGRPWVGSFSLAYCALMALAFCFFALFDSSYNLVVKPAELFGQTADKPVQPEAEADLASLDKPAPPLDWEVGKAGLTTLLAVLMLASVSVAASSRLGVGGNLTVSCLIFAGGLTSQYAYDQARETFLISALEHPGHRALLGLARLWYAAMPNFQNVWMSDALTREHDIPLDYVCRTALYALMFIAAALCVASFLFQKREVA